MHLSKFVVNCNLEIPMSLILFRKTNEDVLCNVKALIPELEFCRQRHTRVIYRGISSYTSGVTNFECHICNIDSKLDDFSIYNVQIKKTMSVCWF